MKSSVSPGSLAGDPKSGAQVVIPIEHAEIHDGESFVISHYAAGKNDGDTIMVVFKTPNTAKRIHSFNRAFASGQSWFYILEGPTFTDNTGSAKAVYNRERNSVAATVVIDAVANPNVPGQARTDPTGLAGGTEIYRELMGGASPKSSGERREDNEFVLKQNTQYAFIIEADANGLILDLNLNFYQL